nr:hypothetical protein [Streptomyces chrestomyceticus]
MAGMAAHGLEGVPQGDVAPGSQDTLGLFNRDAAVQGGVELVVDHVGVLQGTGVDEADGGRVGERLGQGEVVQGQRAVGGAQQQAAEGLPAQPQGHGAGVGVAGLAGHGGDLAPGGGGAGEVAGGDGCGGAVGIRGRAFAQGQVHHGGQGRARVAGRRAVQVRAGVGQQHRGVRHRQ